MWPACQSWVLHVRRIIRHPADFFSRALLKLLLTCTVEISKGLLFEELRFHKFFGFWALCFSILSKNFGSVFETGVNVSWETFWRKKVLRRWIWNFLITILLVKVNLGLSGQKLSAGLPKFVFAGQVQQFENLFFKTICIVHLFMSFSRLFWDFQ